MNFTYRQIDYEILDSHSIVGEKPKLFGIFKNVEDNAILIGIAHDELTAQTRVNDIVNGFNIMKKMLL